MTQSSLSHSPLPAPLVLGRWTEPEGSRSRAGCSEDAAGTRQSFIGFFVRYKACFNTTGETSSSPRYPNYSVAADKDLSVITPAQCLYQPGASEAFGSRQRRPPQRRRRRGSLHATVPRVRRNPASPASHKTTRRRANTHPAKPLPSPQLQRGD